MQRVHKTIETKSRKICSVPQCSSYCTKNISLFYFPTDEKLKGEWKKVLRIEKPISKYMLVCSKHFLPSDFKPGATGISKRRLLKKSAIPSQKIPQGQFEKIQSSRKGKSFNILPVMNDNVSYNLLDLIEKSEPDVAGTSTNCTLSIPLYKDQATQTKEFCIIETLINNDEKLAAFTGLTNEMFNTLVRCAENKAMENNVEYDDLGLSLMLVMTKLKMNMSFTCLSVLFGITSSQCTSIFHKFISLLASSLKPVVYWPSKDKLLMNGPKCLGKLKNVRILLDCTEIKIRKMKCLRCQIKSYSHYISDHTMKYLVGVTPSGFISFISKGYKGCTTGKSIVLGENLLDKFDPHDAIMVNEGIHIKKECNERMIKLIQPRFLKNQKQISKKDAALTAEIARAKVHVERIIQRFKTFSILNDCIDWYLLPYLNEVMLVIAGIVNLSPPILADDEF